MPFSIVRDDITHVKADAIVNAANEQLRRGGGVCGAIFATAGPHRLQNACDKIGHCDTGSAVATPAYALPARYVIHAVGPVWTGGGSGERELLASCYRSSLELAASLRCRSIAFPLISAGIYGYPRREALEVAQIEIRRFLDGHEMDVILVLYDSGVMQLADDLRIRVKRYIDDVYVGAHAHYSRRQSWETGTLDSLLADEGERAVDDAEYRYEAATMMEPLDGALAHQSAPTPQSAPVPPTASAPRGAANRRQLRLPHHLRSLLDHLDSGFSDTLMAMIDERGLKDSEVYKRANLSRQHFSKIRSNPHYQPKKNTVLALAVALELSPEEASMLLERAGYAFSHADQRDVIVEFFIREGIYDVFQINDALFAFDQPLLG